MVTVYSITYEPFEYKTGILIVQNLQKQIINIEKLVNTHNEYEITALRSREFMVYFKHEKIKNCISNGMFSNNVFIRQRFQNGVCCNNFVYFLL